VWKGYWQDIGTPEKYLTSQWDVLRGSFPVLVGGKANAKKVWLGKGVKVSSGVKMAGPSIIQDGCVLEEGADIQPYTVVGPRCRVGKNAVIAKSVLWDDVQVGEGVKLEEVLAGSHCRIGDMSRVMPGSVLAGDSKV
jgi:NDP-sugar pyrophosphorylase family protein